MDIHKEPVVPADMFRMVDETEMIDYASVQGVATRWHVLGPPDGAAYYVVPDYSGPRGAMVTQCECWVVVPDVYASSWATNEEGRAIDHALSNAAFQTAVGIAAGVAAEAVLVESL